MCLRESNGRVALWCSGGVPRPERRVRIVWMTSAIGQWYIWIDFSTARQGTMADKLTPTTLPEYLMWYERLQREIAWFLCQTMLARLQQGATRDEVLRWLFGRPFFLTIPPPLSSGRGSIFRARMRNHHARASKAAGLQRE